MKWKNGGPKFFELQEKCFKGTIATGFALLMSYLDMPLDEGDNHSVDIDNNQPNPVDDDDEGGDNM